tara:strand:- start:347 stop:526 length:180 start_codon:yes stop_codon:yes gene_type:complete
MKNKGVKQMAQKMYQVKFANKPSENIAVVYYKDQQDAEQFKKTVLAKGGKAILTLEGGK